MDDVQKQGFAAEEETVREEAIIGSAALQRNLPPLLGLPLPSCPADYDDWKRLKLSVWGEMQ